LQVIRRVATPFDETLALPGTTGRPATAVGDDVVVVLVPVGVVVVVVVVVVVPPGCEQAAVDAGAVVEDVARPVTSPIAGTGLAPEVSALKNSVPLPLGPGAICSLPGAASW
jgi:hypothetical protein